MTLYHATNGRTLALWNVFRPTTGIKWDVTLGPSIKLYKTKLVVISNLLPKSDFKKEWDIAALCYGLPDHTLAYLTDLNPHIEIPSVWNQEYTHDFYKI